MSSPVRSDLAAAGSADPRLPRALLGAPLSSRRTEARWSTRATAIAFAAVTLRCVRLAPRALGAVLLLCAVVSGCSSGGKKASSSSTSTTRGRSGASPSGSSLTVDPVETSDGNAVTVSADGLQADADYVLEWCVAPKSGTATVCDGETQTQTTAGPDGSVSEDIVAQATINAPGGSHSCVTARGAKAACVVALADATGRVVASANVAIDPS